ncbi:GNAT family N-acetyltransferase [Saccharopolyspora indica]|uniref:GNAT family N-acetyltransferase n=1 Tax=Saccharopolyspora indica TaxID=1229659 RepID=UPI0022EB3BE8|nr:GNAT family N-acetyltransferase [Saccharopolyspora indica]MDA3650043.1 GNAT family N-acetyltransferase [Saccharopolyspora indica]
MTSLEEKTSQFEITAVESLSDELAETISRITSAAYAAGDLVPGLPTADGASSTPEQVRADLAAGLRLWVATADGEVAGAVRAAVGETWEVRRLAVAPWVRRAGTGRALLRSLEGAARAEAARGVVLDAVVERGNPAFYARVGYRTVRHFPAGDKPLSEVHMVRDLADPLPYPEAGDVAEGVAVTWWDTGSGTAASVTEGVPSHREHLLGADLWPGAGPEELAAVRETLAAQAGSPDLRFDRPAREIPAFAMPRTAHPELLAWWRLPGVRGQA